MIKNNNNSIFKLIIFFVSINFYAQESGDIYLKYIDSASNRIDNYPRIAEQFLDSIPNPLEKNIKGKLADYYHLKAVLSSYLNRSAEVYH